MRNLLGKPDAQLATNSYDARRRFLSLVPSISHVQSCALNSSSSIPDLLSDINEAWRAARSQTRAAASFEWSPGYGPQALSVT